MKGNETIGKFKPDNLIYDPKMPIDTKTVELASGQGVIQRGSVIGLTAPETEGALWSDATDEVADSIVCDDVDTGDATGDKVVVEAYRMGHFTRQELIVADGKELTKKAEKQLSDAGIYLSNAVY